MDVEAKDVHSFQDLDYIMSQKVPCVDELVHSPDHFYIFLFIRALKC